MLVCLPLSFAILCLCVSVCGNQNGHILISEAVLLVVVMVVEGGSKQSKR
jgi:hypothetical protein